MGDPKTDGASSSSERAGETRLRGGSLSKDEQRTSVDRAERQKAQDTDGVLRTDGEEDTLYQDGLELENESRPLTGVNGKDDSR
jgi:hypothetical protein